MGYRSYTIKRTSTKKKRLLPLILTIAGVCAAVTILCLVFFTNVFVNKSVTMLETETLVSENCTGTTNNVFSLGGGKLTNYDLEGGIIWEAASGDGYDTLCASDSVIAAYSEEEAIFYDYGATPLFIVDMETPISSVACGKEIVAVMTTQKQEADSSSYYRIYDLKGNELHVIPFESKHILEAGIYAPTDTIYVLSLDTSGVVPICYITTYKSDGTITGSIPINTQLLDNIVMTDTQMFASGTNSLTQYSYFGELEGETLIYGWKIYDEWVKGSEVSLLYTTRESQTLDAGKLYSVKVIDETLSETMIYFPEAINYACCSENNVYAFAQNAAYIYDSEGNLTNTIETESPIKGAKKLSNGYAVVWDQAGTFMTIILIFIFALYILSGAKHGFLCSCANTASVGFSWLIAANLTPVLAKGITGSGFVSFLSYLTEVSDNVSDIALAKTPVSQISQADLPALTEYADLPRIYETRFLENISSQAFASDGLSTVSEYLDKTLSCVTVNIICFVIAYLVVRLLFMLVISTFNFASPFYVLKHYDAGAGAAVGAIRAFMVMFVFAMLAPIALVLVSGTSVEVMMSNSALLGFFYHNNALLSIIPGVV